MCICVRYRQGQSEMEHSRMIEQLRFTQLSDFPRLSHTDPLFLIHTIINTRRRIKYRILEFTCTQEFSLRHDDKNVVILRDVYILQVPYIRTSARCPPTVIFQFSYRTVKIFRISAPEIVRNLDVKRKAWISYFIVIGLPTGAWGQKRRYTPARRKVVWSAPWEFRSFLGVEKWVVEHKA